MEGIKEAPISDKAPNDAGSVVETVGRKTIIKRY